MRDYVLLGDSTADLDVDIVKSLGVEIVPFSYSIDEEVFQFMMNGEDGDIKDFYDKLRNGAMPVTSQVNPDIYKSYFERIVKEGKDILYLCFTSGLSGSYQSALLAADLVKEDYPDAKIVIIDSLAASVGEGVLLYETYLKKKEGLNLEELSKWVDEKRHNTRHWFMVEDLFHLKRGGRVTGFEAMVGSALKIKPILSVDEEGKLAVKSKIRGSIKALEYLVSKVEEEVDDFSKIHFNIGSADAFENAEKAKKMLIEHGAKEENIFISPVGPIIGAHVGPGMVAITYVTNL